MFGLGFGEILIIVFFILVFFGSKEIPNLARTIAKIINQVKHASNELKQEISSTIDAEDFKQKMGVDAIQKEINEAKSTFGGSVSQAQKEISETVEDIENMSGPIKRQK
jgi:sec-independent protein translocase protein TatA